MLRRMSLSREQREILQTFQEIAQIEDESLSVQVLQAHDWNLEESLSHFVSPDEVRPSQESGHSSDEEEEEISFQQNAQQDFNSAPLNEQANASEGGGLLDILFTPIRWLFQVKPVPLNPTRDAQKFFAEFTSAYGSRAPVFHDNSYQSAVATAFEESKFLLVYLHSPLHEDTDKFCQEVLCSPQFLELVQGGVVTWGGRVFDPEAYGLSAQLGVSAFPFMALLVCQSNRVAQIADRIQGCQDADAVVQKLRTSMQTYNAIIQRNRLEMQRRTEAQRLREQQDREYQESLDAERREIERREREERERREAEEKRIQEEKEAEARELSKKKAREEEIQKLKESFLSIPEPDKVPEAATIRFQLPRGVKLERRFLKTESLMRVKDYLSLHFANEGDLTVNFSISTNYPKVEITDFSKTVEEQSLHPRGMLYVQDLDA